MPIKGYGVPFSGVIPGSGAGSSQDSGHDGQLDAVSKWIDENVVSKGLQGEDDKVARLVMRCVLKILQSPMASRSAKLSTQIIRCNKLLEGDQLRRRLNGW